MPVRPALPRRAALLGATALSASAASGQQPATAAPRTVSQAHSWLQLFDEHRLDPRWTLLLEAQARRADLAGRTPQQLLLRTGLLRTVAGASIGGGYAFAGNAVYGEAPAAAPSVEHRLWQQLQFPSTTGPVRWTHRFRTEQRWLERTAGSGDSAVRVGWRFRQRVRAFTRATVDAPVLGVALPKGYLTGWGELFVHAGESPDAQIFDQSRAALQAGWRFSPRARLEGGYMQQFAQRGGSRIAENNHTLVFSLFVNTGR